MQPFLAGVSAAAALGPTAGGPIARLIALQPGAIDGLRLLHGSTFLMQAGAHIGVGCACLAAVLLTVRRAEGRLWTELRALRRQNDPVATTKTA